MPFTFAHPAAVLPFPRNSKWFHFTALVLGSMAPDFEYFLRGEPNGVIGHTILGFLYFNLPIVAFVYFIYNRYIHNMLNQHLPTFLQGTQVQQRRAEKSVNMLIFCYSALLGMFTHILWDSFTHMNGYMVKQMTFLSYELNCFGLMIHIYKILQHGSTLFGFVMILFYLLYHAKSSGERRISNIAFSQKFLYWAVICLVMVIILFIWNILYFVPIVVYGTTVVRIIDASVLSLLVVSIVWGIRDGN